MVKGFLTASANLLTERARVKVDMEFLLDTERARSLPFPAFKCSGKGALFLKSLSKKATSAREQFVLRGEDGRLTAVVTHQPEFGTYNPVPTTCVAMSRPLMPRTLATSDMAGTPSLNV